jgi:hypothetical protein
MGDTWNLFANERIGWDESPTTILSYTLLSEDS